MALNEHAFGSAALLPLPSPALAPDAVVRLQVGYLQDNDTPFPNAGIDTAYRFTSPLSFVEGRERFGELFETPDFAPLLNHREAHYGELRRMESVAQLPVLVTGAQDERVGYIFILRQHEDGPYAGSWMTEAVRRFELH